MPTINSMLFRFYTLPYAELHMLKWSTIASRQLVAAVSMMPLLSCDECHELTLE